MNEAVPAAPLPPPPASSAPAASVPAASAPAPAPVAEKPSFDWTKWDGELDSIEEAERDRYRPVVDHYKGRMTALEKQAAEDRKVFQEYMAGLGEDDPRIAEATGKYESVAKEFEAFKAQAQKELEELRKQGEMTNAEYKAFREEIAKAEVDSFLAAHADEAKDPAWFESIVDAATKLDLGLDEAVELISLPQATRDAARSLVERGIPAAEAIELAKVRVPPPAPRKPSPAADVQAGANGSPRAGAAVSGTPRARSRDEAIDNLFKFGRG